VVIDSGFVVLLGPDYAGKSATMARLAAAPSPWELVSVDDGFVDRGHALISRLRRDLVADVLPSLGSRYSPDFLVGLLQMAVLHLRDRVSAGASTGPLLVDSYYYKILAKCRLAGVPDNPMFAWWRSFPQPRRVVYLDVAPDVAWRRSRNGSAVNRLEHYGERPDRSAFEAFQRDLRPLLLEEIGRVPVSVVAEQDSVAGTARAVREVLSREQR
ncbi:MAG TPA: hypothetical protein VFT95_22720, partial [Micromonosporaceae bacterium]|nr:hypothetical protein [Micromonosporaceae bacterium]